LPLCRSPDVVEIEARTIDNSGRYSGDNLIAFLRFSDGSQGTISYLANGDRATSKERVEVFGGGCSAVLEDFRRLELSRNGRKETARLRWRQDKGHHAEWAAFAGSVQRRGELPIPFNEIVCSTLATLRLHESAGVGKRLSVDTSAFLAAIQRDASPRQ
jgi:predicted dehydrogenase